MDIERTEGELRLTLDETFSRGETADMYCQSMIELLEHNINVWTDFPVGNGLVLLDLQTGNVYDAAFYTNNGAWNALHVLHELGTVSIDAETDKDSINDIIETYFGEDNE